MGWNGDKAEFLGAGFFAFTKLFVAIGSRVRDKQATRGEKWLHMSRHKVREKMGAYTKGCGGGGANAVGRSVGIHERGSSLKSERERRQWSFYSRPAKKRIDKSVN